MVQYCYVGDKAEDIYLALFVDASFAGDIRDSKSASGAYLCLAGPNTFVPINWICKKQGAVSHSSSEAEIIALDAAIRMEGLPALSLWSVVVQVMKPKSCSNVSKIPKVIAPANGKCGGNSNSIRDNKKMQKPEINQSGGNLDGFVPKLTPS